MWYLSLSLITIQNNNIFQWGHFVRLNASLPFDRIFKLWDCMGQDIYIVRLFESRRHHEALDAYFVHAESQLIRLESWIHIDQDQVRMGAG